MSSACDIANYLIYLMRDSFEDLTNMKINKLLYFAQGHSLKRTGHVLFPEKIEAWKHGPIVESVYQNYKQYSDSPISSYDPALLDNVSPEDQALLFDVAREYGRYTAGTLRNMTHVVDGPWYNVYDPDFSHVEIPVSAIKEYFEHCVPEIKPLDIAFSDNDYIGYRDSDGYLVLPEAWDDEAF